MAKIYNSVTELIGNTPLLRANNFIKANNLEANILVKLEYLNPAGSVKDRIAQAMIEDAEKAGISDVVSLFRDNPDLEVVMNGMSQLSRNNGATTYSMIHDKLTDENGNVIKNATQPMSFRPMRRGADGKYEAQEPVLTNATINKGRLIITDQTVDHKVTLYEGLGDQGRKSGALGMQAEIAKNAPLVANYFRNYGNGIRDWRRQLLVAGFDLNDAMQPQIADYLKLAKDEGLTVSEFKISPENQEI